MEYEFRKDFITQKPKAKFNYEHEVLGPWLETEIGNDASQLSNIKSFVKQQVRTQDNVLIGKEYSIYVSFGEVEIKANIEGIDAEIPENVFEDVDDFEQNTQACCGIDDFLLMLDSWQEFIER